MPATINALYRGQPGASVLAAFPQSPQTSTLNEDLIQIRVQGGGLAVRVAYNGAVIGPKPAGALTLTSVAVTSFTVTQVTASTGVVLGTFTGGATNAFAGKQVAILGFTNSTNNGTFLISASSATQITIPIAGLVDETHAATASVYGVSTATYNGTITGGGTNAYLGQILAVTGFTNTSNNLLAATGTLITASTGSTLVVLFAGEIAETHAGSAALTLGGTQERTRVGRFWSTLALGDTLAHYFANAFNNPSNQDILQVVNLGGNVSYYLNYQGVATGS